MQLEKNSEVRYNVDVKEGKKWISKNYNLKYLKKICSKDL